MTHDSTIAGTAGRGGDSGASQTNWSLIYQAAQTGSPGSVEAWEQLARRYWPAIYAYIRKSGRGVDVAADLTQGFVCEVMMGRHLLESADPERGRFRTLLLTALKNYLVEQHRRATRRKRAPYGKRVLELDGPDSVMVQVPTDATPDYVFSAQWGATLVKRVLEQVRAECEKEGLTAHWTVFELRVARPMLLGDEPVPYADLVDRLSLKDAAQAANMMITVKRRFARALLAEVQETVANPTDVEDELHALVRDLEKRA